VVVRRLARFLDSVDIKFFLLTSCSLPFCELSLMGLALDLVDRPSSFSAMTLFVGSFDL